MARTTRSRLARLALGLALLVLLAAAAFVGWASARLASSRPRLDGRLGVPGLGAPVRIERDGLGVVTIEAASRLDAARALGFVHAQDRFFQMDLLRRQAAGELAELLGPALVPTDEAHRVHRFRARAEAVLAASAPSERALVDAYAEGVNAGLAALGAPPFEYGLLGAEPRPWRGEDSILVVDAMFFRLNDPVSRRESALGVLDETLPPALVAFLAPEGTEWDAPLVGPAFPTPPIPPPEAIGTALRARAEPAPLPRFEPPPAPAGSNNWAVAGWRAARGRALVANDMHLGLQVPTIWYRALLRWPGGDGCGDEHLVVGVTLPGVPLVVAGSNTRVAWGFTNTSGDFVDLVVLELDPDDPNRYRTPDGFVPFERHEEIVRVRGEEPRRLVVRETIWGPVVDRDHRGRLRASRWIAHDPDGVNLRLAGLEHAGTLLEALAVANESGIPPQNFVSADRAGHIGWTVAGRLPRRVGHDGTRPASWADGRRRWDGWLAPEEMPRVVDPESGIIWTANARVVGGPDLDKIGREGYDLGARATQIRDALLALDAPDERALLGVQLDDRALFLARWRDLFLSVLTDEAVEGRPGRASLRRLLETGWTGRASIDSVGYRLVRELRLGTFELVYGWLTAPARRAAGASFDLHRLRHWEGPLFRLVTERPPHLLPDGHPSWESVLLAVVDALVERYRGAPGGLAARTWGEANTTRIRHPLSRGLRWLGPWLDAPARPLPGDANMPRVQGPAHGASERLVVSPGHEEEGILHMPVGQSGHPLSPYYLAGHEDWEEGRPTPLLPGPAEHVLRLEPAADP